MSAYFVVRHTLKAVGGVCRLLLGKKQPPLPAEIPANLSAAPRLLEILRESMDILKKTTNPDTFFSRYRTALEMAERMGEFAGGTEIALYAEELREILLDERDAFAEAFVDRCYEKGNLWFIQERLLADDTVFTDESHRYLLSVLEDV